MKNSLSQKYSALVYTTGQGRICPDCRKPVAQCACRNASSADAPKGPLRVRRETKGRNGKAVTLISGAPYDAVGLVELCKKLKVKCGSGGTVKEGVIEIQGDHCDSVMDELTKLGLSPKRSGG